MKVHVTLEQLAILSIAHDYNGGKIIWIHDNVRCGSPEQMIKDLRNLKLITRVGKDWVITVEGYKALCVWEDE
ncbi:hypothetical protein [Xanthomonas albilineans]|uniref:hypothetical protein n=1 Tax=Xanthomonas albilineans TaxID=29447 RepID=UPI0006991B4C|nr:hypothetical protein [Xanthomonas albilineans]